MSPKRSEWWRRRRPAVASPRGSIKWVIFALAVGWSLFQLGIASVFVLDATRARAVHLTFAIVLTFLVFPARKKGAAQRIPGMTTLRRW